MTGRKPREIQHNKAVIWEVARIETILISDPKGIWSPDYANVQFQ
jgi:hypothetical protein